MSEHNQLSTDPHTDSQQPQDTSVFAELLAEKKACPQCVVPADFDLNQPCTCPHAWHSIVQLCLLDPLADSYAQAGYVDQEQFTPEQADPLLGESDHAPDNMLTQLQRHYGIVSKADLLTATPANDTTVSIELLKHDPALISKTDLLTAKPANDCASCKSPHKFTTKVKAICAALGLAIPMALASTWCFLGGESEPLSASVLFEQCKANNAESCAQLGLMYQQGEEVRTNPYVAQALFTRGCSLQNADACGFLGQIYAQGKAVDIRSLPDLPGQASYSVQDIEQMRILLLESEDSRNVLEV